MAAKKAKKATPDPRAARLDAIRREQAAKERRTTLMVVGGAIALVIAIVGVVAFTIVREQADKPSLAASRHYPGQKQDHVETPVTYDPAPPVGGPHSAVWLNCGVYDEPVKNENAVHSMEHGAVWVTYRPDLPAADLQKLKDELPDTYVVLSPYEGLKAPVVASAWGVQLELTGPSDNRLGAFVNAYRQGPQTPEPGALCTGGTDGTTAGTPMDRPTGDAPVTGTASPTAK